MRTTKRWWDEVSSCPDKMVHWLKNQYHGELTAADRILELSSKFSLTQVDADTIVAIVEDEIRHATWIKGLLLSRGIDPKKLDKEDRYWKETIPALENFNTFSYMCAVGHLAELMRLERIILLSEDSRFEDISKVFKRILVDETRHVEAFKCMSSPEDIDLARVYHNKGINALGLVA